jgi:flagella basal body P-ring formation protein FlgA
VIAALLLFSMLSVPAEVTIDADTISLGALIPFHDGDLRAAISLGYAPNPGLARRFTRMDILNKLAAAGQPAGDLQLPDSILVHRRANGLDQAQVTKAILDAFIKRFPDADIEITNIDLPAVQVGTGLLDISAGLPAKVDPTAPIFVRVELRGTSFVKTVFVRTSVRIEADQPVLKNKVAAHAEIQPDDIEHKMAPVRAAGNNRGAAPNQIDGLLAKRDLEPGQVLTNDLLYVPLYVRKGDAVTVKVTSGSVTIAATMRAKAAGKLGDVIPVEHLSGEGSTSARIVGPRILEVNK